MEQKWCLKCGKMVNVHIDTVSGTGHEIEYISQDEELEVDWCDGPFTEHEPSEDGMTVVFDLCNGHDPIE